MSGKTSEYVVLARRYRPSQFEQVIGQEHVTRTLQNAISEGRVHHAYLFTGSRGIGKTTVARILAKALNCESGPTPTPCDKCEICTQVGNSVDIYEIDGASHTGVDDVRELRENVRYLPARARRKIYIIDEVHMLSTSAFNALLKTLEEPPPHVVFVFATTEPHKIPATILSRCQRFDFRRVATPILVEHLKGLIKKEKIKVDKEGLSLIARASEGSVRDALSLLDQVIAYSGKEEKIDSNRVAEVLGVADRRVLFELSEAILKKDANVALSVVAKLFTDGQDLSLFAQSFLFHLRDLIVVKSCKDPAPLLDVTEAEMKSLTEQVKSEGSELLQQYFDQFARAAEEISRSSFPRLLFEMVLIEMVNAEILLPLGDLLLRLEEMERAFVSKKGNFSPPIGSLTKNKFSNATQLKKNSDTAGQKEKLSKNSSQHLDDETIKQSSLDVGAQLDQWQELLKKIEAEQPVAASAYFSGRLLSWKDSVIELGYPCGSFDFQRASDPQKQKVFEQECKKLAGPSFRVIVREMRPEEENAEGTNHISALQARIHEKTEAARVMKEEAKAHPITRAFVEKFGASIQNIATEIDKDVI